MAKAVFDSVSANQASSYPILIISESLSNWESIIMNLYGTVIKNICKKI